MVMFNKMKGNSITQGFFSAVVLALLPNFQCVDLATMEPWKVGQADELCDAGVTLLQLSTKIEAHTHMSATTAVEAGSDSTRLSSCFSKETDVCYEGRFKDSAVCTAVCKQFHFDFADDGGDVLKMGYDPDSRTLCIKGSGTQTRALSTVELIKGAVHSLDKDCKSLSAFGQKSIYTFDGDDNCRFDMAFSADTLVHGCKTKLIPAFVFYKWPEAGLLPDYKTLTPELARLSSHPATESRCGWAGNLITNPIRREFHDKFKDSARQMPDGSYHKLFDIVLPEHSEGPGGQGGRISMEDQVRRWACLVELPGNGFSGRLPYLLFSGRPILMVAAGPFYMTTVWFSHLLKPWVHYIPVADDLSDLVEKAEFALGITSGSNATKIGAAALEFAQTHLSYDAAINYLADSLLELHQAS